MKFNEYKRIWGEKLNPCSNKRRFLTFNTAESFAQDMVGRRDKFHKGKVSRGKKKGFRMGKHNHGLTPYLCPHCGAYHLTSVK